MGPRWLCLAVDPGADIGRRMLPCGCDFRRDVGTGRGTFQQKRQRHHRESTAQINRRPTAHDRAQGIAQGVFASPRSQHTCYALAYLTTVRKTGQIKTVPPGLLCRRSADGHSPSRIHRPPPPGYRSTKTTKRLRRKILIYGDSGGYVGGW